MVELFYFSSLDLMLKVEYERKTNLLQYASHRKMDDNERLLTEQYLMVHVAPKTEQALDSPAMFVYLGTDRRLAQKRAIFHQENDAKILRKKEKEITASVDNLINVAMRNYYSEKIGEFILSARREINNNRQYDVKLTGLKQQLNELLKAYNLYADQKITLDEIIPAELKSFWPGLQEARSPAVPWQY